MIGSSVGGFVSNRKRGHIHHQPETLAPCPCVGAEPAAIVGDLVRDQ